MKTGGKRLRPEKVDFVHTLNAKAERDANIMVSDEKVFATASCGITEALIIAGSGGTP